MAYPARRTRYWLCAASLALLAATGDSPADVSPVAIEALIAAGGLAAAEAQARAHEFCGWPEYAAS